LIILFKYLIAVPISTKSRTSCPVLHVFILQTKYSTVSSQLFWFIVVSPIQTSWFLQAYLLACCIISHSPIVLGFLIKLNFVCNFYIQSLMFKRNICHEKNISKFLSVVSYAKKDLSFLLRTQSLYLYDL